ncbi:alpha/beta fold hydrolase [Nocardia fluminea]|uniref:alpha/beta fold hydrolase n=1 Tax=Nocardia fluminea TaxID=134984 RepID=UPI0037FB427B
MPRPQREAVGELLRVGSHELHVRRDGPADAEPLLLVHGFMESLHWWDRLTPLLSDTFRSRRKVHPRGKAGRHGADSNRR